MKLEAPCIRIGVRDQAIRLILVDEFQLRISMPDDHETGDISTSQPPEKLTHFRSQAAIFNCYRFPARFFKN